MYDATCVDEVSIASARLPVSRKDHPMAPEPKTYPLVVTADEVAEAFAIPVDEVVRLAFTGEMRGITLHDGTWRFARCVIEQHQTSPPTPSTETA